MILSKHSVSELCLISLNKKAVEFLANLHTLATAGAHRGLRHLWLYQESRKSTAIILSRIRASAMPGTRSRDRSGTEVRILNLLSCHFLSCRLSGGPGSLQQCEITLHLLGSVGFTVTSRRPMLSPIAPWPGLIRQHAFQSCGKRASVLSPTTLGPGLSTRVTPPVFPPHSKGGSS